MSECRLERLLRGIREGDEHAARECYERCSERVLRAVRRNMKPFRVERWYDAADFVQMVFAEFFGGVKESRIAFTSNAELMRVLYALAHNVVVQSARSLYAQRRDVRREADAPVELAALQDDCGGPAQSIEEEELLEAVLSRLPRDDRDVLMVRLWGYSWERLARVLQTSPDALRMRVKRAVGEALRAVAGDSW